VHLLYVAPTAFAATKCVLLQLGLLPFTQGLA
jgi:hypothetical protein